jgi:hypothetical protein
MKYNLRKGAVSEDDVVRRSESKGNIKGCPFGEEASGDNANRMIYDSEQVTRCMLNACCSSDDRECDSSGEEMMNNYDVCNACRLGCYEEGNVGKKEPVTDAHNSVADETAITTEQLHEMIMDVENSTSNQKQEFTGVLMKYQGNLRKKSGK